MLNTTPNAIAASALLIALAILLALPLFFCGGCLFVGTVINAREEARERIRQELREERMQKQVSDLQQAQ
jgi:cytochrome c-type biogenesis protein CcmH/NrfG